MDKIDQIGKLLPQAISLEEAVLGALLMEKDAIYQVVDILTEDTFYKDSHKKVYSAIMNLYKDSEKIDALTVTMKVKSNGYLDAIGGAYFISQLTNKINSSANIEAHARIIQGHFIKREAINMASKIIMKAYEETTSVFDIIDEMQVNSNNLNSIIYNRDSKEISEYSTDYIKDLEAKMKSDDNISGLSTGFNNLDKVLLGMEGGTINMLAGRPSQGKTAIAMNIVHHIADTLEVPVAVFSLETTGRRLVGRMVSADLEINHEKLRTGNINQVDFDRVLNSKVHKLPIYIFEKTNITALELKAVAHRLFHEKGIGFIVVDYLQLMGGERSGSREEQVAGISRTLKALAMELNIPIMPLSQLNRSVETRGGNREPMPSDLRESGSLEQDSDTILFVHRPEYYGFTEDREGNSTAGKAVIIIAKNKEGPVGRATLDFKGQFLKFKNEDDSHLYKETEENNNKFKPNEGFGSEKPPF